MRYSKAAQTLSVVGVLVIPLFIIIPAVLGMKHVGVDLFDQNYTGLTSSAFYLVFLAVLVASLRFVQRFPGAQFSLVGNRFNLTAALVAAAFVVSTMVAGGVLRRAFEGSDESAMEALNNHVAAAGSIEFVLTWLAVGALAPIVEELVFRQYLFTLLPYRKSIFWSIGVSALLAIVFAAVHAQYTSPITFGIIAVISFGFGMARVITGGILLPIMMHALVNNMSMVMMTLSPVSAG